MAKVSKLIPCPACRKTISENAAKCPHCGAKNKAKKRSPVPKIILSLLVLVLLIGVVSRLLGGDKDDGNKKSGNGTDKDAVTSGMIDNEPTTQEPNADEGNMEGHGDGEDVSREYKNALKKAENYNDLMHMSRQAIYDQLTSEYGEKFPEDAAQYAIDNLDADYKENALRKAKRYYEEMNMSKESIRDQLISEYGERFTEEEADYAIENLE